MYSITEKLFDDKENSKGLCPVKLEIIINRKKAVRSTGIRVLKSQWKDGKVVNHEHADRMNAIIRKKYSEVEKQILDLDVTGSLLSVKSLSHTKHFKVVPYLTDLIEREKVKLSKGTIKGYDVELKRLIRFDKEASFNSIDNTWLRKYETMLRETMENNTIHKSFMRLKKIFNSAIRDGLTKNYPFHSYDTVKYNAPEKDYLTEKEIMSFWKAIEENVLSERVETSGYYFLLGCFSGLRLSDWLRFDKKFVHGERLTLRTQKTGSVVSMKMHPRLKRIVKIVLKRGKPVTEQKIREHIKTIKTLAGIDKDVSTHTARRSFACLCATSGITADSCAQFMGLSPKVVYVYYKISGVLLDKEVKKFGH